VVGIIIQQDSIPVPSPGSHRKARRRFHVHLRQLQSFQQRRGKLVAARNVKHTGPAHGHGLRETIPARLRRWRYAPPLNSRRSRRCAPPHPPHCCRHVSPPSPIRSPGLRSNPDARRNRARAIHLQRQREPFSGEHILREAMLCTFTGRGAVPPAGTVKTAIPCSARVGLLSARVRDSRCVADQQNPPRSLHRECAQGQFASHLRYP